MLARYLGNLRAVGLGHLVGEVGLLEAGGAHPLVGGGVGAGRRVGRVQAGLDQGLARLRRDHGLQLPGGERVHVSRLARHQQQHLSARQRRQLVRLQETPAGPNSQKKENSNFCKIYKKEITNL